jgi:hypothetical protein
MKRLAVVLLMIGCSKEKSLDERLTELTDRVCACKDRACAMQIRPEMDAWSEASSGVGRRAPIEKPPPELGAHAVAELQRFQRCYVGALERY